METLQMTFSRKNLVSEITPHSLQFIWMWHLYTNAKKVQQQCSNASVRCTPLWPTIPQCSASNYMDSKLNYCGATRKMMFISPKSGFTAHYWAQWAVDLVNQGVILGTASISIWIGSCDNVAMETASHRLISNELRLILTILLFIYLFKTKVIFYKAHS